MVDCRIILVPNLKNFTTFGNGIIPSKGIPNAYSDRFHATVAMDDLFVCGIEDSGILFSSGMHNQPLLTVRVTRRVDESQHARAWDLGKEVQGKFVT